MTPVFPPLFTGHSVADGELPSTAAVQLARDGCDGGLIAYDLGASSLSAAIVFAPEVPLSEAAAMLPLCGVGFQNALGALAPPEVAVHLDWAGRIWLNGARCGGLRMSGPVCAADEVPGWLVIGLEVPLWPASDNPGETPDDTALYAEGCSDVDALTLLEAWSRHVLVWLNRWDETGVAAIHGEWTGLAHGLGEPVSVQGQTGTFLGVDEHLGMLLKTGTGTKLIPLTELLEIS